MNRVTDGFTSVDVGFFELDFIEDTSQAAILHRCFRAEIPLQFLSQMPSNCSARKNMLNPNPRAHERSATFPIYDTIQIQSGLSAVRFGFSARGLHGFVLHRLHSAPGG